MATPRAVEKSEDRGSDYSEGEGQITLSLAHLDSEHFLVSDTESDCSIQSVARRSPYIPKEPIRKSPREATRTASGASTTQSESTSRPKVSKTYPPAHKSVSDARSRRAKAREED